MLGSIYSSPWCSFLGDGISNLVTVSQRTSFLFATGCYQTPPPTIMATTGDKEISQLEHISATASIRSSEKDNAGDLLQAQQLASQWVDNTPEERKLKRKLDWRILPCTWVLYLLGYLDRYITLCTLYQCVFEISPF